MDSEYKFLGTVATVVTGIAACIFFLVSSPSDAVIMDSGTRYVEQYNEVFCVYAYTSSYTGVVVAKDYATNGTSTNQLIAGMDYEVDCGQGVSTQEPAPLLVFYPIGTTTTRYSGTSSKHKSYGPGGQRILNVPTLTNDNGTAWTSATTTLYMMSGDEVASTDAPTCCFSRVKVARMPKVR